jgi:hypothetical protein
MPKWVFVVELLWLLALFAVFVVYVTSRPVRDAVPIRFGPDIPVTVPWFGALGGCLISFGGIFDHNTAWMRGTTIGTRSAR